MSDIERMSNIDEEIDRKCMEADMAECKKFETNTNNEYIFTDEEFVKEFGCDRDTYDKLLCENEYKILQERDKTNDRYILMDEDMSKKTGYLIEHHENQIYVTFWVFQGENEENEELIEKRILFNSLKHLYEASKTFVKSHSPTHGLLHQSKYKMMCDFITYYETKMNNV